MNSSELGIPLYSKNNRLRQNWLTPEDGDKSHKFGFIDDYIFVGLPLSSGDRITIEYQSSSPVYAPDGSPVINITGIIVVQTAMKESEFNKLPLKRQEELHRTIIQVPDNTYELARQRRFQVCIVDATVVCESKDGGKVTYKNAICPLIVHDIKEVKIPKSAQDQK